MQNVETLATNRSGFWKTINGIVTVVGVAICLFHVYTAGLGTLTALKQRALHLPSVIF